MKIQKLLTVVSLVIGLLGAGTGGTNAQTACEALPTESRSVHQITLEAPGLYYLWLRTLAPSNERNSVWVQVDGQCPVLAGDGQTNAVLAWMSHRDGDQSKRLAFELGAGEHAITIAGREAGTGVDKTLLTTDSACVPVDAGGNCPAIPTEAAQAGDLSKQPGDSDGGQAPRNLLLIIGLILVALAVCGFLAWKYLRFAKKHAQSAASESPVVVGLLPTARVRLPATLVHFLDHHKMIVLICTAIITLCLVVGIVAANGSGVKTFEAETGELSGSAKVVDNDTASGGKYVLYGDVPASASGGSSAQKPGGGGSGGGSGGSGNGGTTPTGECPAFPSFPDENCTGWEHTGVTLTDCTDKTDNGYIWDDNKTFDSCYFPTGLTVYGANTTITRSRVKKTISTHWSHNYDFRNLTLVDVEIEDEGNSDAFLAAIGGHNFSCLRCHVHHTGTGIHIGDNAVVRDSYTHDFNYTEGAHGAGIGAGQGNGNGAQVIHNNIQCNRLTGQTQICSSALSLYDEPTIDNVLVQNNLFNTVGGYCVYGGGSNGTNIRFIDNYFGKKFHSGCGQYGPVAVFYSGNTGNVWSGNKWQDGSGDVPPSSNL